MSNFFTLKFIICIVCNISLLTTLFVGYKDINEKKGMIKNQKPVTVKILEIHRGRSRSSCKVEFKYQIYDNIALPSNLKKGSTNKSNFYYDSKNDIIFSSNIGVHALNVIGVLFVLSLFLWLIPKEKFKW
ncbi:hypothetical protein HNP99_000078 [Flavobacterium sp. 28A]|uniref:hypothetical protein n=1 Tax=Flavobacterium sp. 28A TaxID=2735895 RepID=UPI0015702914|nr:hypothetical protein [Flavobacterium sp. 28A]NRT13753.1 hypothetical protein [Flavobacterium sp. 28A]